MRKHFTVILLLLACGMFAQDFDRALMDSLFSHIDMHDQGMGSISVFRDGTEVYGRATGYASLEEGLKADRNTIYRVGSVSKMFTATIIMRLIGEGKLTPDTKLGEYFPEIGNADRITVMHLLRHRSGIFNFTDAEDYHEWMEQPVSREELVRRISEYGTVFEPGEKAEYSNSNYVLLSLIAEKTEGKDFQDILEEHITGPCELRNTRMGGRISPDDHEALSYSRIGEWKTATETHMSVPLGAGAVVSTPADLNRFLHCLFRGNLVAQSTLDEMMQMEENFGIGMLRFPFYGKSAYGHTGGIDGFQSVVAFFPEENMSIAYLSNGVVMSVNEILIGALSIFFGRDYAFPVFTKAIDLEPGALKKYTGVYSSPDFPFELSVTIHDGVLTGQATGQPSFPLEAYEPHKFRFDQAGLKLEFFPGEDKMILRQAGMEFTLTREPVKEQEHIGYQNPPQEILELVDVQPPPSVLMDGDRSHLVLLYRDAFKSIEELSREEMRLAGLRIDPTTNIGSRVTYYNNIRIRDLAMEDPEAKAVRGLPGNPCLANFSWSPDQKKIAFTHTARDGVEVWVVDLAGATATRLSGAGANAALGDAISWFGDSESLLVKMVPAERKPLIDEENVVPAGPVISVSEGQKAQNRTYQDLLKNRNDEHNFEQLALSELWKVSTAGNSEPWLGTAMYDEISFSPDGNYVMISTVEKPFSYLVPYNRFPSRTTIYTSEGGVVETVLEVPLLEVLPKGFMAVKKGRRNLSWRSDRPSTLVFAEALDEGDPEIQAEFRDAVFQLEAPFKGEPREILKTVNRFSGIRWGSDRLAIATDYWWNTRNTKTYVFNPSDPSAGPVIIDDRNYQDRYSDPGDFVTRINEYGRDVLALVGNNAFLIGSGFSPEGQFPFLDLINLKNLKKKRLYRSEYTDKLEDLRDYDPEKDRLLVRIESPAEYPNYFFRNLKQDRLEQITFFENPFKSIRDARKEVITYQREDGLELSATLYLPPDYDIDKREKLPMILWAYPTEYKDRSSAAQNTQNPNSFTYPSWSSPIHWITRDYAVLDDAAFPIVGEGDTEPNDSFRKQLVANAGAAIDAVDAMGYIDRERVGVGGHSYGAFMVANLLSHSDLFAAGIARSGAYNRSLTPFGFQSEERTYWEAPDVYYGMSPFMHADKMKTPLLLIHGEADNNSGTYPMQSTRYFNALKGLGATVRLVILPKESHSYRAKESILHMLWEQDQWLEKYVKSR